jgi:hypothetical protein
MRIQTHETTSDQITAVNSLSHITDPTRGQGFAIPIGMARILGLAGAGTGIDDTITLNSNLSWTFGADAIGALEHEISEGAMGRIGGLGIQNGWWGPMDLFRYSAGHNRDYRGPDQTYFSVDDQNLLFPYAVPYNQLGIYDGADFGDWSDAVVNDAFGPGGPGEPGFVSNTDLVVMANPTSCGRTTAARRRSGC